ncbi:hypothetical protein CHUAL_002416 [Chamberlinius hualienensis]
MISGADMSVILFQENSYIKQLCNGCSKASDSEIYTVWRYRPKCRNRTSISDSVEVSVGEHQSKYVNTALPSVYDILLQQELSSTPPIISADSEYTVDYVTCSQISSITKQPYQGSCNMKMFTKNHCNSESTIGLCEDEFMSENIETFTDQDTANFVSRKKRLATALWWIFELFCPDCCLVQQFMKDFAIPRQEFSPKSPSANADRRSSSCSDKTKEFHICQSSSPEVNEITSSVSLKNSWFVAEDDDCFKKREANCHQLADERVNVSDLNETSLAWTSPPAGFEDADVESTAVGQSDTVSDHHKTGFKSTKERNVPKCVRRVKAASSPSFCDSRTDAWVSEGDLRRPWSQICSEQDVERLVQARSCAIGSGSMSTGIDAIVQLHPSSTDLASESGSVSAVSSAPSTSSGSSNGNTFGSRFASMRSPNTRPPASSVEGVLQKFRKSFSARFYKKVKAESPPSSYNVSISARHASFSSYLNDHLGSDSISTNESIGALSTGDTIVRHEPDTADNSTVFRLGPIVWRSSKEKKGKKVKKHSIGGESVSDDKSDSNETANKDNLDLHTKSFTSNGSTITLINHPHPNGYPPGISVVSPRVFPRRAHATSLRAERPKRPLSEQGSSHYGSVNLHDDNKVSEANDNVSNFSPMRSCPHRNGSSSSTSGLPPKIVIRREKMPTVRWSRERTNLRRSISQPLEIERLGAMGISHSPVGGLSDHDLSSASSEEDFGSDNDLNGSYRSRLHKNGQFYLEYSEPVMYAEALWDHVTLDSEELPFKAGDLIEVLDKSDLEWWWGIMVNQAGWFPASFVRIRVNQEDTVEDCFAKMENGTLLSPKSRNMSSGLLSSDQVRTKVIMEIFNTEKDFVQHLKDVCEGYLKQVRKRPDMFSEERLSVIFGNIEQLYNFQSQFVSELEQCINWEDPHLSEIGSCFIKHKDGFEIYSEYCNNHPQAVNELQQLYSIPKYAHFFEACRLLQDMIDIALDGFLLTPVQKICKYPLQLGELLKYTKTDHPDYYHVEKALKTMRNVAQYINERKRRMECLEKLAAWQTEVEDWEGGDILDLSSELIYSGDVYKVTTSWSRDFTLFLFDHQLLICKKDLLKRHSYTYKSRICVDNCEIRDILDGKDVLSGLTLKNAWKVFCAERGKWYIFATRTPEEKSRWMKAFSDERRRVAEDRLNGFVVSDKSKKMAVMVVQNKKKPKKPKDKENKDFSRRMSRPEIYTLSSKSGSLPSNVVYSTNKKKTASGWFHFGSNKKTKR